MVAPLHIARAFWHNIEYLSRLNLRCIVKLHVGAAHSEEVQSWVNAAGIEVVECCVAANKEPFVVADAEEIHKALRLILDPQRQPVLIHSLRGQARMGVVIACLRKLQQWSYTTIIEEYRRFTGSGARYSTCSTLSSSNHASRTRDATRGDTTARAQRGLCQWR